MKQKLIENMKYINVHTKLELQKREFNLDEHYVSCPQRVSSQEFNSINSHAMSYLLR